MVAPHPETVGSLFFRLAKLHMSRSHTLFHRVGLSRGQPPVLFRLWEEDGCTQSELSERIMIRPATMTSILQRMEKAGYIRRRADSEDLRVTRVYLTDKGRELKGEVEALLRQLDDELTAGFSEEEMQLLRQLMRRMADNLAEAEEEG